MTSIRIPRKPGMTDAEYDKAMQDAYRRHDQRLRNFHEFFINRGANRYVDEAVRNTLGNEEAAFKKQMREIQRFQYNFRKKLILANPKIAREHSIMERSDKPPSREYQAFMREANARSNTAVRKQFKNVLPAMNKYQARRQAFERDMQDKYAAANPRYARYLTEQRRREQASQQNIMNRNKAYEKWAKQNDPSAYKVYMRDKKRYGNPANMVSNAFMNARQNAAVTKSMQKFYAQDPNYSSPFLDKYRRLATPVKPKKIQAIPNSTAINPRTGNPTMLDMQRQQQALFDAQRAQFLNRQQEAANKLKPIKTTTTTTSKPAKPVQPVPVTSKNSKPNRLSTTHGGHPYKIGTQQPTYIKKSGGKVTKKYANGGSVRKPKYKG
jgi:hypothetical protein